MSLRPRQVQATAELLADGGTVPFIARYRKEATGSLDETVIRTVAAFPTFCSYFDVPIQHAEEGVLKRMGRHYHSNDLKHLFDRIRTLCPEAVLRTTVMVGFPGERERDFEILLDFVEDVRFDHLGVFIYSDSDDLISHRLPDHVPVDVARERYDLLMRRQQEISTEHMRRYRGRHMTVLVEEKLETGQYAGRTSWQAPEVDGSTYITDVRNELMPGQFTQVCITDSLEYDLIGETV